MKFNPWPIAITTLCIAAFAAAATVVVVMVRQRVELVTPDYYAQDLVHQQRIDAEQRAMANPATISHDDAARAISIALPQTDATGTITLYRPSDLSLDREYAIALDANGRQVIPAADLAPGLWRVRVSWTANGDAFFQEEKVLIP